MTQQIKEYRLGLGHAGNVLVGNQRLVLNETKGILSMLEDKEGDLTHIVEQQILTDSELYLVAELLQSFPDYCPYEVLLSAMTNETLETCRQRVHWGLENGTIDTVMRPVRNLLSRCRVKLNPLGIEITSLHETGYILTNLKAASRFKRNGL